MKKLLFLSFLLVSLIPAFAKDSYRIKVKVNGIKDTLCYLGYYYGDKQYLKDSVKCNSKGEFVFKSDTASLPGGIYLIVLPGKKFFEVLVDKNQDFSLEADYSRLDDYKAYKVIGSDENRTFFDYTQYIADRGKKAEQLKTSMKAFKDAGDTIKSNLYKDSVSAIDKEVVTYKKNFIANHPDAFLSVIFKAMFEPEVPDAPILSNGRPDSTFRYRYYKAHYWDNIDFKDDRILRTPIFHNKLKTYMQNLTLQMPDSIDEAADYLIAKAHDNKELFKYIVWYVTYSYETSEIMGMDAVFVHMAEKYYMTKEAYWIDDATLYKITDRAITLKPILLGKKAPNLVMKDVNGSYKALHDVKAKYTILVFWDPDCGHCKKAMPVLDSLYRKVKAKGVEVYAVDCEHEMDKWRQYIKEHDLKWINVADSDYAIPFKKTYEVKSTPIFFLLDENKEIIAKKISVQQVGEILEQRFKDELKLEDTTNFKKKSK